MPGSQEQQKESPEEGTQFRPTAMAPSTRAKLAALAFILQEPEAKTIERALQALTETLPKADKELLKMLTVKILENSGAKGYQSGKKLAHQIREFVSEKYVDEARERGDQGLVIEVKDVHRRLGLHQRYSAVLAALQGKAFLERCRLELLGSKQGPDGAKSLTFRIL